MTKRRLSLEETRRKILETTEKAKALGCPNLEMTPENIVTCKLSNIACAGKVFVSSDTCLKCEEDENRFTEKCPVVKALIQRNLAALIAVGWKSISNERIKALTSYRVRNLKRYSNAVTAGEFLVAAVKNGMDCDLGVAVAKEELPELT